MEGFYYFGGQLYQFTGQEFSLVKEKNWDVPPTSEGLLLTGEVERRVKYIQGKILTVIDAVIAEKEQKKAVKDIINQIISHELYRLSDSATGFHTLSEGDMVQFSGSPEKFVKEQVEPVLSK